MRERHCVYGFVPRNISHAIKLLFYILGKWECSNTTTVLNSELRKWVADFNIPQSALKMLLLILKKNCVQLNDLSTDPRTLMHTPRQVNIEKLGGLNAYWHLGLEKCLRKSFKLLDKDLQISLNINVDGLPLFNASNKCFWPILCNVSEFPNVRPMAVGIFFGDAKPANAVLFMQQFVDDVNRIITGGGIRINGHKLSIRIRAIICDSPARAFLKGNYL